MKTLIFLLFACKSNPKKLLIKPIQKQTIRILATCVFLKKTFGCACNKLK